MNALRRGSVIALFTAAPFAYALPSAAQQTLKAAGQDVPPWVVHGSNASALSGIFVELTNAIAKDAGLHINYQTMVFADLIPAVSGGTIDLIATNLAITPERAAQVDFSMPLYNAPPEQVVVPVADATAYRTLADLKGLPVGAQKGSIQLALLNRTGGFSEIKVYDTVKDAWAAVAAGQVRAAVTAGPDTIYAAKHGLLPNLRIASTYQSPTPKPKIGFAVRKGDVGLLGKINASLTKLIADGTVKALFIKYGIDDWVPPT